jgi:hypothetical protein
MRNLLGLVVAAACLLATTRAVSACSCVKIDPLEALSHADLVFRSRSFGSWLSQELADRKLPGTGACVGNGLVLRASEDIEALGVPTFTVVRTTLRGRIKALF